MFAFFGAGTAGPTNSSMSAKLLTVIVVMGAAALTLLLTRQLRIEASARSALLYQRLVESEHAEWKLLSEIAARSRPDELRRAMAELGGSWTPIPFEVGGGTQP